MDLYRSLYAIDTVDDKTFTMHFDKLTFAYNAINGFGLLPEHLERQPFADASAGAPLLKLPRPSDYAKAAVFLASDDAEMITAFDLRVDAGAVSRYWIWNPGDAVD